MAIPSQSKMFQIVLQIYSESPDGLSNKDVNVRVRSKLHLSKEDVNQRSASKNVVYMSRAQWSISSLRMAGCINRSSEGFHRITPTGRKLLSEGLDTKGFSKKMRELKSQHSLLPSYEWTQVYAAIADAILDYRSRQNELVQLLSKSFKTLNLKQGILEYEDGVLPDVIDPFSFFAAFNRGINDANRTAILADIVSAFGIECSVPTSFNGIPVKLNFNARFVDRQLDRESYATAVDNLWDLFEAALIYSDDSNCSEAFIANYDKVLPTKYVSWGITWGLYWARPTTFIGLDGNNRSMLEHDYDISIPQVPTGKEYLSLVCDLHRHLGDTTFYEFSYDAWEIAKANDADKEKEDEEPALDVAEDAVDPMVGWFLGASIDGVDLVDKFKANGEWRCGNNMDSLVEGISSIPVGAHVALKKAYTRKRNVPFKTNGQSISVMRVCARGVVTDNPRNGCSLKVDWEKSFESKEWYLFTYQQTFWRVERTADDWRRGALIDFTFNDVEQDMPAFLNHPFWKGRYGNGGIEAADEREDIEEEQLKPYSKEQFMDDVFIDEEQYDTLAGLLERKLNVILQGPPGVGKTFAAKRLAYSLMGVEDDSRIAFTQFHASTTYEDVVVGYRPTDEGGFVLENGSFVKFCDKAVQGPDEKYFFIIDEINRADVSRVFGELMMTIEKEHRDEEVDLRLANGRNVFKVPSNVYIIAMMNTADRSIAMMDYALRRRFAFYEMTPAIDTEQFLNYLCGLVSRGFANEIVGAVQALNEDIKDELGKGYCLGHSYFMDGLPGMTDAQAKQWFKTIVDYEVAPLLEEYWFDDTSKANNHVARLLELCE